MTQQHTLSRRQFLRRATVAISAAAVAPYIITSKALGDVNVKPASERLTMGFIGIGNQGGGHLGEVKNNGDVQIVAFSVDGLHPHDIATIIDRSGIAVRAGHHCAQPLMERLGVPATCRASFAMYSTRGEVDALVEGLRRAHELFA